MADISKDELRKEITAILKNADLTAMSAKKVRQQLEEKLDCKLMSRKKEIDELVMDFVSAKEKKLRKNNAADSEDEEEDEDEDEASEGEESVEEIEDKKKPVAKRTPAKKAAPKRAAKQDAPSDEESEEAKSDVVSEEEYNPKKAAPKPKKKGGKRKKGSESDSDEDWSKKKKKTGGKRKAGNGYTRAYNLSPELAALMGEDALARHEVVKRVWGIIKEKNLYDPKNKQYAICNDALMKVIGVKRFRTFGMMKYLKTHFVD